MRPVLAFILFCCGSAACADDFADREIYCRSVREDAKVLLRWRFGDDFDLVKAKRDFIPENDPLYDAMLLDAWNTEPVVHHDVLVRLRQIDKFADYWFGQCLLK